MRAIALCALAATAVIGLSGCGQTISVHQTATSNSFTYISNIAEGGGGDMLAGFTCSTQHRGQCTGKVFQKGAHGLVEHSVNVAPIGETFVNRTDGWIIGQPAFYCQTDCGTDFVATTDGGSTWRQVFKTSAWAVSSAVFSTPTRGFAIGTSNQSGLNANQPSLYVTSDGGSSWTVESTGGYAPQSISFPNPQHGWMAGIKCTSTACQFAVLASTDGGATWSVAHQVGQMPVSSYNLFLIDFVTNKTGWIMVGDGSGCDQNSCFGSLYRTTDGGGSWVQLQPSGYWPDQAKLKSAGVPPGWPDAMNFATANVGWIPANGGGGIGTGGIELTVNGGGAFRRIAVGHQWSVVSLVGGAHGATAIVSIIPAPTGQAPKQELVHVSLSGKISTESLP